MRTYYQCNVATPCNVYFIYLPHRNHIVNILIPLCAPYSKLRYCRVLDLKIFNSLKDKNFALCPGPTTFLFLTNTVFLVFFVHIDIFKLIFYQVHQLFMYRVCLFKVKPSFFEVAMTCVQRLLLINRVHFFTKNSKSVNLFSFCCVGFGARLCVIYFGRLIKKI